MPKFVQRDQSQLYLLPPDIRDWLPADDLAHFVVEGVERVSMSAFEVNERGTALAQYHPRTMLALLVYCYANDIFGSRRIGRATLELPRFRGQLTAWHLRWSRLVGQVGGRIKVYSG